jgi:hypothetical protein
MHTNHLWATITDVTEITVETVTYCPGRAG